MSWTTGVVKHVLPNRLTVLVQRETSAPVVAVVTHVKAGYFDEPDEWVGISHVLEHMAFKGDLARAVQRVGGYVNAATIYDRTSYFVVLPSHAGGLERALAAQSEALMRLVIEPDPLIRELDVVIEELKRKLDTPAAVAAETLYGLLFSVHRMRRWRIGTEAGLRRLTAADVRRYYATRYTPDRVIVAIVGDVEPDAALRLAEATWGGWSQPATAVTGSPAEPEGRQRPAVRVFWGDLERPVARLGWRTAGTLPPDAAPLDLTALLLGAGRGSRLYRALRLPGLADSVAAWHYTPTEVGVFELEIQAGVERLDDAVVQALGVVRELGERAPEAAELDRVRILSATSWARRMESTDGRAALLCEAEALGDVALAEALYQRLFEVTPEKVQRIVAERLAPQRACAVFYLPRGTGSRFAAGGWPPAVRPRRERLGAVVAPPGGRARRGSALSGAVQHAGGIWRWSGAGADVIVRSKRGAGLVTLGLHFAGVPSGESRATAGISWLTARGAVRGAGGMTAEELAHVAERLGGVLAPDVGRETLGWWTTVRADRLRDAAALLRLVALEPALEGPAIAVERDQQVRDARAARDDMFHYPLQRVLGEAFPGDPYGLPLLGEPESLAALSDAAVWRWATQLARRRATVVAVGDLEPEALLAGVEVLADWPGRNGAEGGAAERPRWGAGRRAEQRDKAQSAVAMAFPAEPFDSPDRYPLIALSTLLGGLAGRLFEALRERRALVYSVTALPWLAVRAGAMLGYAATSPEREEETRAVMLQELSRVVREPPGPDALARARNAAAGAVEVRRQRGRAVAAELLDGWVHGALEDIPLLPAQLRAVPGDAVVRVAEQVFQGEVRAECVVRGVKRET